MALFQAALQIEQFWANFITSKGCVLTTVNLKMTVNPAGDSLYRYNVLSILPSQVYEVCKCINCSRKADAEKVAHTVLEKVSLTARSEEKQLFSQANVGQIEVAFLNLLLKPDCNL